MAKNKKRSTIREALVCGLIASTAVSLCWFCASKNAREVGVALVVLSAAAWLIWFISLLLLKKACRARKIISLLLVAVLNFCAYFSVSVYYLIPTQLFYPKFDEQAYSELSENPAASEISIQTDEGTLYGWFLKKQEGRAPLIIYCGGNGENASHYINSFSECALNKAAEGCNIVMTDYPGYGKSDGKPSDTALRKAALAVYDAMKQREDVDSSKIIIVGYSLGTGAANYIASRRDVAGLVLMAPYADGYDLVNRFFPVFYGPLEKLVSYKMPASEFAASVNVTPLIFASPDDESVAYSSSVRLYKSYKECIFITCDGLRHDDFRESGEVAEKTAEYIKEILSNG